MKAIVRIGDLRAAVDRAMLAVERRSTIPILSCLHLSQSSKGLTVMGTALDMVVTATSPVLSAMGAPVCVNGHRFARLLRALPREQEARFNEADGRLTIDVPDGRFAFLALPAHDWPELSVGDQTTSLDVPLQSLAGAIARLTPFICTEETRYYLNGIHLHVQEGKVVAVATDGHRLGVVPVDIDAKAFGSSRAIIIPRRSLNVLASLLRKREEKSLRVEFHGDAKGILRMSFALDGVRLDTKLIDGTFPEYRRVFPPSIAVEMDASPGRLLQVMQRMQPFWQGNVHGPGRLHVPVTGQASIACGNKDDGAILAAPIRRVSGQAEVLTSFNSAYFRACLQAAGGTTVRMRYADAGSPLHFVAEDGGEFLCMPLRFVETLFTALPEGAGLAEAA